MDVLRWTMHETCKDIHHHLPYWAEQGIDHHKRFAAYTEHRLLSYPSAPVNVCDEKKKQKQEKKQKKQEKKKKNEEEKKKKKEERKMKKEEKKKKKKQEQETEHSSLGDLKKKKKQEQEQEQNKQQSSPGELKKKKQKQKKQKREQQQEKEHGSSGDLNFQVMRSAWLQCESRTLEEMYSASPRAGSNPEINDVPALSERIERLGITTQVDARVAEEQEREVNHEIQWERQVERPPNAEPAKHILRREVLTFVETGNLPLTLPRMPSLMNPIDMARTLESTKEWSPSPLATTEFTTTVLGLDGARLSDYLRPVNWILSSGSGKDSVVIVISPYEANELLPIIRRQKKVLLHIYAPRVTSTMRSFSDLTFYSIPDSPAEPWTAPAHARTMLNLFAGQLYFDSKEEYESVCVLLALSRAHPDAKYCQVDGFVPPEYRTGRPSPFSESKVYILKTLLGLRRKGMGYSRTHLGQLLNAIPLSEDTLAAMS
jgi:hypothetical protein